MARIQKFENTDDVGLELGVLGQTGVLDSHQMVAVRLLRHFSLKGEGYGSFEVSIAVLSNLE